MYDDLEQHGHRGSMRVFGIPEHTTATVDDMVLYLVNQHLKVTPPLVLEDIEVAHHLGKPPPKPFVPDPAPREDDDDDDKSSTDADQSSPTPPPPTTPPRAIIVKFASRRTKLRVMRKSNQKDNPLQVADGTVHSVYMSDDLTQRRAKLAYQARLLRRSGAILDTWTYDSQILIKITRSSPSRQNPTSTSTNSLPTPQEQCQCKQM